MFHLTFSTLFVSFEASSTCSMQRASYQTSPILDDLMSFNMCSKMQEPGQPAKPRVCVSSCPWLNSSNEHNGRLVLCISAIEKALLMSVPAAKIVLLVRHMLQDEVDVWIAPRRTRLA